MQKSLLYNRNHGVKDAKLFQVGKIYFHPTPAAQTVVGITENRKRPGRSFTYKAQQETFRMGERTVLSFLCDRIWKSASWEGAEVASSYFSVKQLLEKFLRTFTSQEAVYHPIEVDSFPFLHPHAAATVSLAGVTFGWLGELHPGVTADCELQPNVVACELDLERLFELIAAVSEKKELTFHKFPPTTRDMALLVNQLTCFDTIKETISHHPRQKHLETFSIFDVYEGDQIPVGKKSMAFSLTFRSPSKTLTDEAVEKELTSLKSWLVEQQGVEFR
jgi:phenylalanyl-tRNA synthetase beta chain